MKALYLHEHPEFSELLRIVADEQQINEIGLVEKDYWIMHCLHGLNLLKDKIKINFQLKGGTSLSKGYKIIDRFSEDIDIKVDPPSGMDIPTGLNHDKVPHKGKRKRYQDWLNREIKIDGIIKVERDHAFDDLPKYRSGGIRLYYKPVSAEVRDLKQGILLEAGFDKVTPNKPITISSWAYDYAKDKVDVIDDNQAYDILCYHPGYTLVEKPQTISTKFRKQELDSEDQNNNFMRHYYDVYCLLQEKLILDFISTDEYFKHKKLRFRGKDNPCIKENQAFLMESPAIFDKYDNQYRKRQSLYYREKPSFREILDTIKVNIDRL